MPTPAADATRRTLTFGLKFYGATADLLWANVRAVWDQRDRMYDALEAGDASDANLDAVLEMRFGDATSNVRFDLRDADLQLSPRFGVRKPSGLYLDATLTLTALPYARGAAVTGSAEAITSGADSYVDITDVRGDVPALTRLTFVDESNNSKVVNRITLGVYSSRRPIDPDDLELAVDATAVSPGSSGSESNTIGGTRSRLAMTAAYQNVARFDRPAALTNGRYHAFCRVRDSSNLLTPPVNLTAVPQNTVRRRQRSAGATNTGTSAQGTWPMATLAGSLLVMYVTSDFVSIGTPSGWSVGTVSGASGGSPNAAIFYKANAGAESGAAAASTLSGSSVWDVVLEEWIGITTTSPLDRSASDRSSSSAASMTIGPTSTPTQDEELVLAVFRGGANPPTDISGTENMEAEAFGALSMTAYGRMAAAAAQSATATYSPNTDRAGVILTFKASNVANEPLDTGLVTFRVVANGAGSVYSAASEPVTVRIAQGQAVELDWDAGRGTVSSYSIYMTDSVNGWVVAEDPTFSGTSAVVGGNTGSIGTSIPPGAGTAIPADVRVGLSLANGETVWWQDAVRTQYANSAWELLYLGVLTLPPAPTPEGDAPLPWQVHVQARHFYATGNLDVDALLLLPAWGDMAQVEVPTLDLATLRKWVTESHRDGSSSARLLTTDTSADAGQPRLVQQLAPSLRPGFNRVQWLTDVAAGANDVADGEMSLAWEYVPRYRFVTGQP